MLYTVKSSDKSKSLCEGWIQNRSSEKWDGLINSFAYIYLDILLSYPSSNHGNINHHFMLGLHYQTLHSPSTRKAIDHR